MEDACKLHQRDPERTTEFSGTGRFHALYLTSDQLLRHKDVIEEALSRHERDLFGLGGPTTRRSTERGKGPLMFVVRNVEFAL